MASPSANDLSPLTARETDVLRLIADGNSTKEIASKLGLSFKTVVTHRCHLAKKIGSSNAALLTRYAIRSGIIEP